MLSQPLGLLLGTRRIEEQLEIEHCENLPVVRYRRYRGVGRNVPLKQGLLVVARAIETRTKTSRNLFQHNGVEDFSIVFTQGLEFPRRYVIASRIIRRSQAQRGACDLYDEQKTEVHLADETKKRKGTLQTE